MLETIREFGREQLVATHDDNAVEQRHAAFFLKWAMRAAPHLRTAEQLDWLARLDAEHDNMRAALAWSVSDSGDPDLGLRLAGALSWFWPLRGHLSEGRHWIEATLARCTRDISAAERLTALIGSGQYAAVQGDHAAATPRLEQALATARALGDRHREAYALTFLGFTALQRDASPELIAKLQEASAALFREVGDTWGLALASNHQAVACLIRGDYSRARALGQVSADLYRKTGDRLGIGLSLGWLGLAALRDGDRHAAREHYLDSLSALRPLQAHWVIERAYRGLAEVAHLDRDHVRAARLLGAAHASLEAGGTLRGRFEQVDAERAMTTVRGGLGERAFASAWARGHATGLDEAAEVALTPGSGLPTDIAGGSGAGSGLTEREREVAALVARGMTNRQIAAELVIAVGTAQRHVANILGKLDVASRTQIATWVVERD
jgi:DNA-binding CsgD family transcriptional regulator/tetratricopeptide (TPR) repeat protein